MIESSDPYVYPGTDVLRNLQEIRDSEVLGEFEAEATAARIAELGQSPAKGEFNTAHLQSIHKYIFQDVFSWAGQFRTVNISKGGHSFAHAHFIGPSLNDLFRKLAAEKQLRSLERAVFIRRAAFFLGELNAVHPFREGNGRTQRQFFRQLAAAAGYSLSWRGITRDQMIAASRSSFLTGNCEGLAELLQNCLR